MDKALYRNDMCQSKCGHVIMTDMFYFSRLQHNHQFANRNVHLTTLQTIAFEINNEKCKYENNVE